MVPAGSRDRQREKSVANFGLDNTAPGLNLCLSSCYSNGCPVAANPGSTEHLEPWRFPVEAKIVCGTGGEENRVLGLGPSVRDGKGGKVQRNGAVQRSTDVPEPPSIQNLEEKIEEVVRFSSNPYFLTYFLIKIVFSSQKTSVATPFFFQQSQRRPKNASSWGDLT